MNIKHLVFKALLSKIYRAYLAVNFGFQPLEFEDNTKCLCLAPHADDESIGMGGTLLKQGVLFDVICMTNGACKTKDIEEKKKIISRRKSEFETAMNRLNLNFYDFWEDVEDREFILHSERFLNLDISQYDYIFVPNILDQHRDHKAVAVILYELLKSAKYKKNLKIVFYEVWQTLALPNCYIDISDVIEQKKELINVYESQLATKDYTQKIVGLNNYRGLAHNLDYAEAFCLMDIPLFRKICKIYNF